MRLLAWRLGFLRSRGLSEPDGRPLCAFKCSDDEFVELEHQLQEYFACGGSLRRADSALAAGFVLFGAEWFRRRHEGGHWTWDGIFGAVGLPAQTLSHQQRLYRVVELGLRSWGRRLSYVGNQRAFLMTLAAEGGLPLRLLHDERAHLRRYFRALFEQFELFGRNGLEHSLLAARVKRYLPRSFQQDVVYRIAGDLAGAIWRYSNEVGDCESPLDELERIHPNWRQTLPIAIQDDTAEALLRGLLTDATTLSSRRAEVITLRAETYLRRKSDGWIVERELRLPGKLTAGALCSALDLDADTLPLRFELALDDGDERKTVALVSRKAGEDSAEFIVEPLHRSTTRYQGKSALHPLQIVAECGHRVVGQTELSGASDLGSLPWIFVPIAGSDDRFRLVSRGSARVRHDSAIAAVTATTDVSPDIGAIAERVGVLGDVERTLFRVQGIVRFADDDTRCSVRTAAPADDTVEYVVRGSILPYSRGQLPVHVGVPRIYAQDSAGSLKRIRPEQLQWRPHHLRNGWRSLSDRCFGEITLRHVHDGETRYEERFNVLPAASVLEIREAEETHETGVHSGAWLLCGTGATLVGGADTASLTLHPDKVEGGDWCVTARATAPVPSTVTIALEWSGSQKLDVELPFPGRIVRFLRGTSRELVSGASIQWQELGKLRAQAIVPSQNMKFVVSGRLTARDLTGLTIEAELHQIDPFTHELDLGELRRQAELLFAATRDLGAHLRLEIECKHGYGKFPRQEVLVTRFDGAVVREEPSTAHAGAGASLHIFSLVNARGNPLELDPRREYTVEARALWNPSKRVSLAGSGNAFSLTDSLTPGTWLVIGKQGASSLFRPLVLPVEEEHQPDADASRLLSVCNVQDYEARRGQLDEHIQALATDVAHEDWNEVLGFIDSMVDVPPTTFDLLDRLVVAPDAVALAALKVSAVSFGDLWDGLEHLPFSWALLPVQSWLRAAQMHVADVRRQLEGVGLPEELHDESAAHSLRNILETAPRLFPPMQNVADLVQREVLGRHPANSLLQVAGSPAGAAFFYDLLEQERIVLRQVHADERWPAWRDLDETVTRIVDIVSATLAKPLLGIITSPWRAPLMCAPVLAALASAGGVSLARTEVYNLRRLEEFDPFWFRTAYGYAHTCACAALHPPGKSVETGSRSQMDSAQGTGDK